MGIFIIAFLDLPGAAMGQGSNGGDGRSGKGFRAEGRMKRGNLARPNRRRRQRTGRGGESARPRGGQNDGQEVVAQHQNRRGRQR
jgi:hypothetical protein